MYDDTPSLLSHLHLAFHFHFHPIKLKGDILLLHRSEKMKGIHPPCLHPNKKIGIMAIEFPPKIFP